MLTKSLKLACAVALLGVLGACDGASLMEPEEAVETAPVSRTACMAGGEAARRAGCPGTAGAEEDGYAGEFGPVDDSGYYCPGSLRARNKVPC
jgi:hypothetical protein